MILTTTPEQDSRIQAWSEATRQPPEAFIREALDRALEDWEDYAEALRICAEVDAGRMKTYTLSEVTEQMNALEG